MKVKKHFYCIVCIVAVLALLTAGCGGGGSGSFVPAPPPSPPSNPPSPPSNPDNPQPPSNPSDNQPPSNPQPPQPPGNQPPSNPAPQLNLWYPSVSDPESVRVVGSGTLLTILGEVYNAEQIVVYDQNGTLLETFSVTPGMFRIDLSQFGTPGRKTLKIVARGSGGESVVGLEVINDAVELERLAREAIERYGMRRFAWPPYGLEKSIPIAVKLKYLPKEYVPIIQEAANFWTRYTSLKFDVVIYPDDAVIPFPSILVVYEDKKNPGPIAETFLIGTGGVVEGADVYLYARFAGLQPQVQAAVVAHELWHALTGGAGEITDLGFRFVGWPWLNGGIEVQIVPPLIQKAFYLLYR